MNSHLSSRTVGSPAFGPTALRLGLGLALACVAGACAGGGGGAGSGGPSAPVGSMLLNSATGFSFLVEDHQGGEGTSLRLLEAYWGRLVDIHDFDAQSGASTRVFKDFVISDVLDSDGVNYRLERDPLTEREKLTILYPRASNEFLSALANVEQGLQVMLPKSLDPSELPPFTSVARNAAVMLRFNDLLSDGGSPVAGSGYPGLVTAATVELLTGYAPTQPYEARVLPDPNHGDLVGGEFHTTRVILDLTVSADDAQSTNLPVNSLGLPEALVANQPNGVVRLATRTSAAAQQFEVLRSLGGRALSFNGNGPTDPLSATFDVVRAFRSGGRTAITGDANNGFLVDHIAPVILGSQVVYSSFTGPLGGSAGTEFDLTVQFETAKCAVAPTIGDVIEFPNHRVQVIQNFIGSVATGIAGPFRVNLLCDNCVPSTPPVGTGGVFRTTFRAGLSTDPDFPACFVRFSPTPTTLPNAGVPTTAMLTVTFSEPMDPNSVQAFDTFTVEYDNNAPSTDLLYRNVVGGVMPSTDLRQFTFQPTLPLRKQLPGGNADQYKLLLLGGVGGVTDLAGNTLVVGLPATPFKLATTGATVDSGSISLKLNTGDENGDGHPEIRGQFLYDLIKKSIRPRAPARFSAVVDPTVAVVGAMIGFPQPLQTPLSNYGSRMATVWRYFDLGMGLRDETTHNLDVEGLWWQPFSGLLQTDHFTEFQIGLAHSKFLPDEEVSSGLLPAWVNSGLVASFEANLLDKATDPLTPVHPKAKGYTLQPSDVTMSSSAYPIAPWPLNRGIAQSAYTYWTWRDTSKIAVGGPGAKGVDSQILLGVTKTGNPQFYDVNKVPTIGLPLFLEFRTYPDAAAVAQNGFRVALAINSSARPYFRAFSTGGVNPNNPAQIKTVYPDSELTATGAYSQNGNGTYPLDNVFYFGQGDFLVRVSRMHTMWFDTKATGTLYSEPVVEPAPDLQPGGTQVLLAYRGANSFQLSASVPVGYLPYHDASMIDPYGDNYTTNYQFNALGEGNNTNKMCIPSFFNNPANTTLKTWKSAISILNGTSPISSANPGARYFQARVTFICNPLTALSPELSALGFAYRR